MWTLDSGPAAPHDLTSHLRNPVQELTAALFDVPPRPALPSLSLQEPRLIERDHRVQKPPRTQILQHPADRLDVHPKQFDGSRVSHPRAPIVDIHTGHPPVGIRRPLQNAHVTAVELIDVPEKPRRSQISVLRSRWRTAHRVAM